MGMTKVTRNFQITLPKDARVEADIKVGDTLKIVAYDKGQMRITKASAREAILKAAGLWKDVKDSVGFIRAIRDRSEKERPRL